MQIEAGRETRRYIERQIETITKRERHTHRETDTRTERERTDCSLVPRLQ